ncbi:hypothetical protein, partial [Massilia timonae]|uniref:hypothetical protein n=1 Tax=Massilia timonae TaxID=47229 RepID=UPI00289D4404
KSSISSGSRVSRKAVAIQKNQSRTTHRAKIPACHQAAVAGTTHRKASDWFGAEKLCLTMT